MATYKVIQDVEAEDKLIGPLTPRQFLYAGVCVVCLYLTYYTYTRGAGFMAVIFLPIVAVTGFFAFPWGRDQPTEIWALAKIRFMIKPRRRIWDQSGVKELVTITAPKRVQTDYTKGLSPTEVQSRLRALADTIDSRGWAIKNSNLNLTTQTPLTMAAPTSDRLVTASALPQTVTDIEVTASDDILDEKNNATAGRVDSLINAATSAHRKKIVESLKEENGTDEPQADEAGRPKGRPNNYWFLNQPDQSPSIPSNMVTFNTQVVTPSMAADDAGATAQPAANNTQLSADEEEARLVAQLEAQQSKLPTKSYYGHLHTIQPLSEQQRQTGAQTQPAPTYAPADQSFLDELRADTSRMQTASPGPLAPPAGTATPPPPPVTPAQQAAILQLANNNDLNVATIAREAQRSGPQDDEVVIKLH